MGLFCVATFLLFESKFDELNKVRFSWSGSCLKRAIHEIDHFFPIIQNMNFSIHLFQKTKSSMGCFGKAETRRSDARMRKQGARLVCSVNFSLTDSVFELRIEN